MSAPSKEKIETLIDNLLMNDLPTAQKEKALNIMKRLPLTYGDIERIRKTYNEAMNDKVDNDILQIAVDKEQERYQDAEDVLKEASQRGIENLDMLCTWLGLPKDTKAQEIIDKMHLYKKTGTKGKPELSHYK